MMKFSVECSLSKRKKASLLVLPFWQEDKKATEAAFFVSLRSFLSTPLNLDDFKGKEGELLFLYEDKINEKRIVLLGLGKKKEATVETLRRAYATLAQASQKKKLTSLNLLLPSISNFKKKEIARGIAEGLLLPNYQFEKYKSKNKVSLLKDICLIGGGKEELQEAEKRVKIMKGVYLARDLSNSNADEITPIGLANVAKSLQKDHPAIKVTVLNKAQIKKEKMGLLLAVNQGSTNDPVFIIAEYKGNPKKKEKTILVGKGLTFDSGGLNLKSTGSIETMKSDMSGAAIAFGTLLACANLKLKENITLLVPSTDNSIGPSSYKPGDVYKSHSGKTVEVGNTDAEGRLILADALSYAIKHCKPTRIIDLATLTGAIVICLGEEATGLMTNNDALAKALLSSGERTFERLWRLPLFEEYKEQLKSDIADISNVGGRKAGSITAGLFLQEFVKNIPWAHLDVAGTSFLDSARRYHPKNGTGIGVRLLVDFFEQLSKA